MFLARRPPAFYWKTLRESGGGEEAGGIKGLPGASDGDEGAELGDIEWADGDKRFGDKGGARVQHQ